MTRTSTPGSSNGYLEENASAEQKRFPDRIQGRERRVPRRNAPTPRQVEVTTATVGHTGGDR